MYQRCPITRFYRHGFLRYGSCRSLRLRQLVGVGVPALVGLLGSVLVGASPERPGVAVRLVATGLGDDGPAQLAQQSGTVTGISPRMPVLPSRARCQAAATARKAQASRLIPVGGPVRGQVQSPAGQRVPGRGGAGQGDRDLAQRDAAEGAAVLAGRARAVSGGLRVRGLVQNQHHVALILARGQVRGRPACGRVQQQLLIAPGGDSRCCIRHEDGCPAASARVQQL
jgi:hypothetical protein